MSKLLLISDVYLIKLKDRPNISEAVYLEDHFNTNRPLYAVKVKIIE
jgi:hypothetical protein